MKFFHNVFLALAALASMSAVSGEMMVPGVGTVYESTLVYTNLTGETGEVAILERKLETLTVQKLINGLPVFSGEVFGYRGELTETNSGTIVYTDECKSKIAPEVFTPPSIPNQCGWHVCNPPEPGTTLTRTMVVYAPLYDCQPKVGRYSFTAKERKLFNGEIVTIGDANVSFGPFAKTSWTSYVKDGLGEVYAVSSSRVTTYPKVEVKLTPYVPATLTFVAQAVTSFTASPQKESVNDCDVVAFGDSLTEGMGASRSDSYPAKLSKILGKEVCNMGISGNTSEVLKVRVQEVIAHHPKVVLMTIGANDLFQGISKGKTRANIISILDQFKEKGVLVVVLGFNGVASVLPSHVQDMLGAYDVAQNREDVLFLPDAFVGVLNDKKHISSDGMHPNALGYGVLANNVMDQAFGLLRVYPLK